MGLFQRFQAVKHAAFQGRDDVVAQYQLFQTVQARESGRFHHFNLIRPRSSQLVSAANQSKAKRRQQDLVVGEMEAAQLVGVGEGVARQRLNVSVDDIQRPQFRKIL